MSKQLGGLGKRAAATCALTVALGAPMGLIWAGTSGAADTNCTGYPGAQCTTPSVSTTQTQTSDGGTPTLTASSSSGLAFTGADISEMAAVGAAALAGGGLLVWRSRRRHLGDVG